MLRGVARGHRIYVANCAPATFAACWISWKTCTGGETGDRWSEATSRTVAPMRLASKRWRSGLITRSFAEIRNHEGSVPLQPSGPCAARQPWQPSAGNRPDLHHFRRLTDLHSMVPASYVSFFADCSPVCGDCVQPLAIWRRTLGRRPYRPRYSALLQRRTLAAESFPPSQQLSAAWHPATLDLRFF